MGLDMYLYTYPEGLEEDIKKLHKLPPEERDKIWDETYEIGYWRKYNFLHKYLCDNGELIVDKVLYFVPRKVLYEFLEKAVKVVKRQTIRVSSQTLPVCEGLFYGSYEYDDYYYGQVHDTIIKITEILRDNQDDKFLYYASW